MLTGNQINEVISMLPDSITLSGIGLSRQVYIHDREDIVVELSECRIEPLTVPVRKLVNRPGFIGSIIDKIVGRKTEYKSVPNPAHTIGFNWGYSGDKCKRFSLSLLSVYLPVTLAEYLEGDFTDAFVSQLPQEDFKVTLKFKHFVAALVGMYNPVSWEDLVIRHAFNYKEVLPEVNYMGRINTPVNLNSDGRPQ